MSFISFRIKDWKEGMSVTVSPSHSNRSRFSFCSPARESKKSGKSVR